MKAECTFITQEWDGTIPALQAGKFDAYVSSMSITEERKKQVDFSDKYYNTPPGVAAPKDTDIKGVTKEDLAGKTIGVQVSTTHANYAEQTFTDSTIKAYPTAEEYRLDLANGRLDAVNDDSVTLSEWLKTPDGACCKTVGNLPAGRCNPWCRRWRCLQEGPPGTGRKVQRCHQGYSQEWQV